MTAPATGTTRASAPTAADWLLARLAVVESAVRRAIARLTRDSLLLRPSR